ncbi:hypothetical protein BH92_10545 [Rhodococcoides fascians A21d2]|uniref:hypothetical protein n=1 Tax=Rhodococcoides fascians TaxID=1828 RepID=UPI00056A4A6D|nr:hypothetical protein [Rhodococcus fascians]QII00257.1 hypothetical protein BH92_10545 [Rhodococcus fascians A21d2]
MHSQRTIHDLDPTLRIAVIGSGTNSSAMCDALYYADRSIAADVYSEYEDDWRTTSPHHADGYRIIHGLDTLLDVHRDDLRARYGAVVYALDTWSIRQPPPMMFGLPRAQGYIHNENGIVTGSACEFVVGPCAGPTTRKITALCGAVASLIAADRTSPTAAWSSHDPAEWLHVRFPDADVRHCYPPSHTSVA